MKKLAPDPAVRLHQILLLMIVILSFTIVSCSSSTSTTRENGEKSLIKLPENTKNYFIISNAAANNQTNNNHRGEGESEKEKQKEEILMYMPEKKTRLEEFRDFIYRYILPIMVTIGIVGNTLTIIILSKEHELNALYDPSCTFQENLRLQYIKQSVSGRSDIVTDPPSTTFAPNATVAFLNNNNNNGHKLHQPSRKNTEIINNNSRKNKKPSSYNTQFSSTNYFIFSLAVSDLIYNFFLALVVITKNDIMNILDREYFCEISVCITYICSFLSAAFTTLFTFQRFIAIVNPLKSATSFSLQSTRVIRRVIIVLIVFACLAYSYSLFIYDAELHPRHNATGALVMEPRCAPRTGYKYIAMTLENTLDSFLTMIVPAVGILYMNFSICRALSKYSKENIFYSNVNSHQDTINKQSPNKKKRHHHTLSYTSPVTRTSESNNEPLSLKDISRCHSLTPSRCVTPARNSHSPGHNSLTAPAAMTNANDKSKSSTVLDDKNTTNNSNDSSTKQQQQQLEAKKQQQQQRPQHHFSSTNIIRNNSNSTPFIKHNTSAASSLNIAHINGGAVQKSLNNGGAMNNYSLRTSFCREQATVRSSSNISHSTRITKMLLIVSFSFIILNSPYRAAMLISHIHMLLRGQSDNSTFEFMNEVLLNLYFASYSVNFFLYSFCGKKFRESFRGLCFAFVFFFYYRLTKLLNCILKRRGDL